MNAISAPPPSSPTARVKIFDATQKSENYEQCFLRRECGRKTEVVQKVNERESRVEIRISDFISVHPPPPPTSPDNREKKERDPVAACRPGCHRKTITRPELFGKTTQKRLNETNIYLAHNRIATAPAHTHNKKTTKNAKFMSNKVFVFPIKIRNPFSREQQQPERKKNNPVFSIVEGWKEEQKGVVFGEEGWSCIFTSAGLYE
ncbi:hypothetical protein CEXT_159421 [Caerostris extrusa]|uniref:Uncharacterized protein n=1 Tax=Caerostris extrusa TaxID=172846 RepID=A0AAV4T053_CAEEX|nr:hypothetical protein CEXT_159421 [Caerostris extrusa]